MLFKLLKYDFRSMWKTFSLVWAACLVIALVNRLGRDWMCAAAGLTPAAR